MRNTSKIVVFIILIIGIIIAVTTITARLTYKNKIAEEQFTEPDMYKMQEYSNKNSMGVFQALKDGDRKILGELVISNDNFDKLLKYANWDQMDIDKVSSSGAGSMMPKPDKNGRMDVVEMFGVKIGGKKYVVYIQTVVSRWGKANDGVSCIAVTTTKRYEETDGELDWKTDKEVIRAGKMF